MNPQADAEQAQVREEDEKGNGDDAEHRTQEDSSQSFPQAKNRLGFCHEVPIISLPFLLAASRVNGVDRVV